MTQQEEIPDINNNNSDNTDDFIQPLDFQPANLEAQTSGWKPSSLQITLSVTFVISIIILGYLFSAKSLYIRTNTVDPTISVDGLFTLAVGERFLLLTGEHAVNIEAEGYHPYQDKIDVNTNDNQYHDITLKPLPGHLTVISNALAQVFIDKKLAGDTSRRLDNIEAGEHQLRFSADRYQSLTMPFDIEGRNTEQTLDINLLPNWADITINSTPSGATVFTDDGALGKTPLTTQLLAGKRNLTIKLPGHKPWRQSLRVTAQQAKTLANITLSKADGLVEIISKPSGASVTVNGKFRGKTPVDVALAPGNHYQFTLFKDGYQPLHQRLKIESGKDANINVSLTPKLGKISIISNPKDALLYVDGRLMGRANQTITLPTRKHTIRVSKDGYADHTETVLPGQNLAQKLSIKLLTNEEFKWKNIKSIVKTASNQTLLLFKPDDTFAMGASRREQGRRANEAQRNIKLDRPFYLSQRLVTNAEYRKFDRFHSSGHVKGNLSLIPL